MHLRFHVCIHRSIKAFADKYLELGLPLHMLINNAGVFLVDHDHTQEGFEVSRLFGCIHAFAKAPFSCQHNVQFCGIILVCQSSVLTGAIAALPGNCEGVSSKQHQDLRPYMPDTFT